MFASMQHASTLLDGFLDGRHKGCALDRPVLEYLASSLADAADSLASHGDIETASGAVAEAVSEYLHPPVRAEDIQADIAELVLKVSGGAAEAGHTGTEPGDAPSKMALSAAAAEFVPSRVLPADRLGQQREEDACSQWRWPEGPGPGGWGSMLAPEPLIPEEAALEFLVEHFPHYSVQHLRAMLQAHGGDLALTADVLTQFENELGPLGAGEQPSAADADAEDEPRPDGDPAPSMDDEESFPSLGSGTGGSAAPTVLGPLGRADGFAAALRKKPHTAAPKQPLPSAQRQPSARRTAEAANLTRACNSVAAPIKWVETGTAVESMYRDARSTARDHARIRNAYFQQATQAYLSGNRALAKELGAKGRAAGEAMKEAHEAASQQIYHSRNQQRARGEDGLIDLHGLHISEAISFLERELEDFRQQGRSPVYVLVGTGHHTRTHRATLPVAVENYLKERVVPFRVSQPGLLELRL